MCEIADRIRNEGKMEGKIEGKIEGMMEAILELLGELGRVPARIVEHIKGEDDLNVLSKWLKTASKAASIAEFEANM